MSKGPETALLRGRGGRTQSRVEENLSIVLSLVASARQVPVSELLWPTRSTAEIAFARQIAMYLVHVAFGVSLSQTGRIFGRDRTTAAHACSLVEDRRDDHAFDLEVHCLEAALLAADMIGAAA
jgi:chromosomal replication initiation ATPase DnaA